jgi:AraC family transcriptional regulator
VETGSEEAISSLYFSPVAPSADSLNTAVHYEIALKTNFRYTQETTGELRYCQPANVALKDQNKWAGLRLEKWEGGQKTEGIDDAILGFHAIALNIGTTNRATVNWHGHKRREGNFPPGTFMLMPERIPYSAIGIGPYESLIITIPPGTLQASSSHGAVELIPQFAASDAFLAATITMLAHDVEMGYPAGPMYGEALEAALYAHLIRHYASQEERTVHNRELSSADRQRVVEFILDQLHGEIRLSDLAGLLQMDADGFAKRFKRSFGIPPHRFLIESRISRAKALLKDAHLSLVAIALSCGFNSHSHFTTAFRQHTGLTPSLYRLNVAS